MLHRPEEIYDRLKALATEAEKGADAFQIADQMLAVAPDHAPARLARAVRLRDDGDVDGAIAELWRAIDYAPCGAGCYLTLAETLRMRNGIDDPLANGLRRMAIRKLSGADEIHPLITELFEQWDAKNKEPLNLDFTDPESFQVLATIDEIKEKKERPEEESDREPTELENRLLPYQLLTDFQYAAPGVITWETLEAILENQERCLPLWRAALREWAEQPIDLGYDALCLITAVMGEIATPQDLEDLWELSATEDVILFRHAHFALYRIGQRLPEAALAGIRAEIPGSSVSFRCGLAEQLIALKNLDGVSEALVELTGDLAKTGHHKDAPYLLMLVSHGLAERGREFRLKEVMARHSRHLSKDGLQWYREMIEDETFLPMIVRDGLDELDIKAVVLERDLLEEDEEDEEDGEDGEDGEESEDDEEGFFDDEEDDFDEAFIDPIVKPIRPGRNDPCWCGSGKKYKKCHLDADAAADRGESA